MLDDDTGKKHGCVGVTCEIDELARRICVRIGGRLEYIIYEPAFQDNPILVSVKEAASRDVTLAEKRRLESLKTPFAMHPPGFEPDDIGRMKSRFWSEMSKLKISFKDDLAAKKMWWVWKKQRGAA